MMSTVKNILLIIQYKLKLPKRGDKLYDHIEAVKKKNKPRAALALFKLSQIEDIQTEAMSGLSRICYRRGEADPKTTAALIDILANAKYMPAIRGYAASGLGYIKEQRAVPLLKTIMRDAQEDQNLRESCMVALGRIRGTDSYQKLIWAYQKTTPDDAGQASFTGSGAQLKNHAVDLLMDKLASEPESPAGHLPPGLGIAGENLAIEWLTKELSKDYARLDFIEALAWIGGSKLTDTILKHIEIDVIHELPYMSTSWAAAPDSCFVGHKRVLRRIGFDEDGIREFFKKTTESWEKKVASAASSSYSRGLCPYCNYASTQLSVKNGKSKYYCPKCKSEFI